MADDGNSQNNTTSHVPHQETFQCTPEAQVEHRYPTHTTGIISLPPGSRGPRSLYLRRQSDSFGFTLRHFIVYPPDSVQDATRQAQLGTVSSPMDTIFVKNVARYSPAEQAGLQHGDRIVAVNGVSVTDKTYAQVIYLIQHSPEYLHLLVVPKEEDVLQKFFAETAHNPISNQQNWNDLYSERKRFHRPLPQLPQNCRTNEFQADALSWKSLQEAIYASPNYDRLGSRSRQRQQRSADNLLYAAPIEVICHNKSEEILDDVNRRSRAQPQVPLYRKMGRRASEGSTISNKEVEQNEFYTNSPISKESNAMVVGGSKMKGSPKFVYPEPSPVTPRSNENAQTFNYPNSIGCRLSLDGRRESTASMSSSLADGSKDSLSSYDSMSTLTGQDTDDSIIMTRLRKNLQQKEEFLRRPSHPAETPGIQREFYGRPKKLEKQTWPPNEHVRQESPSKTIKPVHQNFQRVKADIETERDFGMQIPNDGASEIAGTLSPQQRKPTSKEWHYVNSLSGIKEGSIAPEGLDNHCQMNGAASVQDEDRRLYLRNLQMVTKRTKQFESGKSLPEDDPMFKDRTSFYKSELARISSKRVVPHVTTRAHEFESRSSEPRRDTSGSSTNSGLRRQHRDSRSLDSSDMLRELEYQPSKIRARSNSAESWAAVMQSSRKDDTFEYTDCVNNEHLQDRPQAATNETRKPNLSPPIIPETVESLHKNPLICITHDISSKTPPIRPNQLDLNCPIRPARRRESRSSDSSPRRCSSSENSEENRPVVIRRTKNLNLGDEERAMRRESYLKATGNGRMQVDDFSDGEISPHLLRSAHRKWRPPLFPGDIQQLRKLFEDAAYSFGGSISGNSSSSVSLEREKTSLPSSPLEKEAPIKEGLLYCKIAEIDGKRAADRSWKQVWVVLRESKLFLYKDRHHQSPSEAAEQSLANGVDMSASCVRIAEDYTKRKHVLRVSSVLPCRSELLLQAENPVDLADWVKALQEQVAANDTENKSDTSNHVKQQAVPQTTPALTTIQVQGSSRLSPQPNKSKLPSLRNRSPTGQSPVSKTRKPSQVNDGLVSPKSKTWRGRVAKQFRKIQGGSSPSSPTAPEGSTFGAPLELCFPSNYNQNVPRLVEVCTDIVESKGLDIIGVYRVPGNSAAITALTNSVNQSFDGVSQADPHWNDVHVVSSLLKSFFRKLPDALLTSGLYTSFIEADKIEDPNLRMEEVRKLVRCLPPHHYHTLRHLMLHLKKVTDNCDVNKMEGRNLAIVFGPTLIRAVQDDMATLVNDMTHNYKIVESLICYADWFFSDDNVSTLNLRQPALPVDSLNNELDVVSNRALLLDNISKVEGMKGEKVPGRELFSSIISAAHRKMWKGGKTNATQDSREDSIPNGIKEFTAQSNFSNDLKQNEHEKGGDVPTTVIDMEKSNKQDRGWLNYSNQEQIRRRVENFIQETQANLQRNRRTAEFYGDSDSLERVSNSIHHMNQENNSLTSLPTTNSIDSYAITKTQSASNVFHRPLSGGNRNSNLSHSALAVQYTKNSSAKTDNKTNLQFNKNSDLYKNFDLNRNNEHVQTKSSGFQNVYKKRDSVSATPKSFDKVFLRRGSSVENVNSSTMDITTNGTLKKVKYGNEIEITQRTGSLDSLNKLHEGEDGSDLQATIMKIFDEKKKTLNPLLGTNLPFADESPERPTPPEIIAHQNKENIPASPKIYRNPSLHKNSLNKNKFSKTFHLNDLRLKEIQKEKLEEEKDKDCSELVPDNDRHISNIEKSALTFSNINNKPNTNFISGNSKLRRSESLNKPERTVSPLNMKLKRSESLNKASDRLKRSDSLTKNEKTENNINKRRELSATRRTNKELTKLKRKNGMPERSIKRRHTVGGTKDFDKVNWLDNRCYQEKDLDVENQNKEKCTLRTSSPDLSSARRERLLFEVNLFGPENIVVALRQHLIGVRPQSLPEPRIFTVPLESHV